ncbi:hypothetical protein FGSG_04638 [Fusarium graminearum PH-1]|uniref:hypothetical protein n=1 Tax=Gibberella zeae (strain ATCC MYA-4620 / CBS 123657 / FGSC 9075 / NRRL 31084 / PH-1) TaxID=229533 RepID=UPI000023E1B0|nr:hypothetical protein FGSG_04638 [Fusarium graminearum PH-1]ESU08435.1 hypothetical protein FGSG_04638 [Fusarium graminearum PH-1]|eukprot:XP_011320934.1 hypothetical protein FGSG_04638 [Fusarium graminearum PH-1]
MGALMPKAAIYKALLINRSHRALYTEQRRSITFLNNIYILRKAYSFVRGLRHEFPAYVVLYRSNEFDSICQVVPFFTQLEYGSFLFENKADIFKRLLLGWIMDANIPLYGVEHKLFRQLPAFIEDQFVNEVLPMSGNTRPQFRLLSLEKLSGSHGGEDQAILMAKVIQKYGLEKKIELFATDNAHQCDTCIRALLKMFYPRLRQASY